jgi:hypothetical protein
MVEGPPPLRIGRAFGQTNRDPATARNPPVSTAEIFERKRCASVPNERPGCRPVNLHEVSPIERHRIAHTPEALAE